MNSPKGPVARVILTVRDIERLRGGEEYGEYKAAPHTHLARYELANSGPYQQVLAVFCPDCAALVGQQCVKS
jgi:hypothetical protein